MFRGFNIKVLDVMELRVFDFFVERSSSFVILSLFLQNWSVFPFLVIVLDVLVGVEFMSDFYVRISIIIHDIDIRILTIMKH